MGLQLPNDIINRSNTYVYTSRLLQYLYCIYSLFKEVSVAAVKFDAVAMIRSKFDREHSSGRTVHCCRYTLSDLPRLLSL
jgi:hypothetical protein